MATIRKDDSSESEGKDDDGEEGFDLMKVVEARCHCAGGDGKFTPDFDDDDDDDDVEDEDKKTKKNDNEKKQIIAATKEIFPTTTTTTTTTTASATKTPTPGEAGRILDVTVIKPGVVPTNTLQQYDVSATSSSTIKNYVMDGGDGLQQIIEQQQQQQQQQQQAESSSSGGDLEVGVTTAPALIRNGLLSSSPSSSQQQQLVGAFSVTPFFSAERNITSDDVVNSEPSEDDDDNDILLPEPSDPIDPMITTNLVEAFLVNSMHLQQEQDDLEQQQQQQQDPNHVLTTIQGGVGGAGGIVEAVEVKTSSTKLGVILIIFLLLVGIVVAVIVPLLTTTTNKNDHSTNQDSKGNDPPLLMEEDNTTTSSTTSSSSSSSAVTSTILDAIEIRVQDTLNGFMSSPIVMAGILERFNQNGAFQNNLDVRDKDTFLSLIFSLMDGSVFGNIYYASEEGMFVGHEAHLDNQVVFIGEYQEPQVTYNIDDPDMKKYYHACVDSYSGEPHNCTVPVNAKYVQCIDNCSLVPCLSTSAAVDDDDDDDSDESSGMIWCPQYDILVNQEADTWGYVPATFYCLDMNGAFSQEPGGILQKDGTLGNCLYGDGVTLVNRSSSFLLGDYLSCQGSDNGDDSNSNSNSNNNCNIYEGGYRSLKYDARYRPWYMKTKQLQRPNWYGPYIYASGAYVGITYSTPYYAEGDSEHGGKIFRGAFGFDYTIGDITQLLQGIYGPDESNGNFVVVYETQEPHYLVAASTGRSGTYFVLEDDATIPCPQTSPLDAARVGCIPKRSTMSTLHGSPFDEVLTGAYLEHQSRGVPDDGLAVSFQAPSDAYNTTKKYHSRTSLYATEEGELEWTILAIVSA